MLSVSKIIKGYSYSVFKTVQCLRESWNISEIKIKRQSIYKHQTACFVCHLRRKSLTTAQYTFEYMQRTDNLKM